MKQFHKFDINSNGQISSKITVCKHSSFTNCDSQVLLFKFPFFFSNQTIKFKMFLSKLKNLFNSCNKDKVEKEAGEDVPSCTATPTVGNDQAPKLGQQGPASSVADENIPPELADIAKSADVDKLVQIGRGAFSSVYIATNSAAPNEKFAIKIANIKKCQPREILDEEVDTMKLVSGHQHFLKFYGNWALEADKALDLPARYAMKMEFVPFSLFQVVNKAVDVGTVSLECLRRITKHMVEGCKFLHGKNIVHHDIKPENVMVRTPNGRGLNEVEDLDAVLLQSTFVLIDFGAVEFVEASNQATAESTHPAGTKTFMSKGKFCSFHSEKPRTYNPFLADAYAVGCTVFCVADTIDFIGVKNLKRTEPGWVSFYAYLKQAAISGKLGQLYGSKLLVLLSRLMADKPKVFLSMIDDDAY